MSLRKRLAKLEARREVAHTGPRIIIRDIFRRSDGGRVQSIGAFTKVLTALGWQTITRKDEEPEAEFQLRAEAMAGDAGAGSAWAMAALKRKHATLDPN